MVFLKIALGSLVKRKKRMISIGLLVFFGAVLIVFGQEFARSAKTAARRAIVENLTGDVLLYSADSKERPSALSWTTPLGNIKNIAKIREFLAGQVDVESFTAYAQNYAIIMVSGETGRPSQEKEIPFIFTAVEPQSYVKVFDNFEAKEGSFFGLEETGGSGTPGSSLSGGFERGIVVSDAQNKRYQEFYDVTLKVGDAITLLGLSEGGSVNAIKTVVRGIYTARSFENIYDYVNFMDIESYSSLYNFTGVDTSSLPPELLKGLSATSEDEIFGIGGEHGGASLSDGSAIDFSKLKTTELSGFSLVSVRLKDGVPLAGFMNKIEGEGASYGFKAVKWDEASGGFAKIASFLGLFIYGASGLVFLIVALIIMNTLIINILERTAEIGTIRAIGGSRGFIRLVFLTETLVLNGLSGLGGIAVSSVLVAVFSGRGISLPPVIARYLVGGGRLYMSFEPGLILQALLIIVVISVIATLYPLSVATRVTPLKAMSETMQ